MPNHCNVAPLLGFCTESISIFSSKKHHLLVYPFLVNLSLAFQLREHPESMPPLNWQTRKRIMIGVAQGLSHLHGLNIIHRDIKAANVLLDERYGPLVTDFGNALFLGDRDQTTLQVAETTENRNISSTATAQETEYTTGVRGTVGHIAPEYLSTGRCSRKTDVFGFGIMLLELISGQRAFDLARLANDEDVMLLDWIKGYLREGRLERVIDENMEGNYDESEVKLLVMIALLCTQNDPSERPNMRQVIQLLQVNELDEIWQDRIHTLLDAWESQNDAFGPR